MEHGAVDIISVTITGPHRVALEFSDGARRERDLEPLLTGPVFSEIRSSADAFARVRIDAEVGTLVWPSGVDIDAELLRYDDLWEQTLAVSPAS